MAPLSDNLRWLLGDYYEFSSRVFFIAFLLLLSVYGCLSDGGDQKKSGAEEFLETKQGSLNIDPEVSKIRDEILKILSQLNSAEMELSEAEGRIKPSVDRLVKIFEEGDPITLGLASAESDSIEYFSVVWGSGLGFYGMYIHPVGSKNPFQGELVREVQPGMVVWHSAQ